MKKIISIIAAAALLMALSACGTAQSEVVVESPAVTEAAPESAEPSPVQSPDGSDDTAVIVTELSAVLDDIDASVTIGTAGSSLKAARAAAQLLDWAVQTDMSAQQVKSAVVDWLSPKGNDVQVQFAEKLSAVDSACTELQKDSAKDLLDSAGCQDSGYPWTEQAYELVDAVMQATGLR